MTTILIAPLPPEGLGTWVCARCATLRVLDKQVQETAQHWTAATCADCQELCLNQELYLIRAKHEHEA